MIIKVYKARSVGAVIKRPLFAALYRRPANYLRTDDVPPDVVCSCGTAPLHGNTVDAVIRAMGANIPLVDLVGNPLPQGQMVWTVAHDLLSRAAVPVPPNIAQQQRDLDIDIGDLRERILSGLENLP